MDEEFLFEYDHELDRRKTENSIREESYEDGLQDGLEKGTKQRNIEIAKSMLKDQVSIELVSKYTGIRIEELEKLIASN